MVHFEIYDLCHSIYPTPRSPALWWFVVLASALKVCIYVRRRQRSVYLLLYVCTSLRQRCEIKILLWSGGRSALETECSSGVGTDKTREAIMPLKRTFPVSNVMPLAVSAPDVQEACVVFDRLPAISDVETIGRGPAGPCPVPHIRSLLALQSFLAKMLRCGCTETTLAAVFLGLACSRATQLVGAKLDGDTAGGVLLPLSVHPSPDPASLHIGVADLGRIILPP